MPEPHPPLLAGSDEEREHAELLMQYQNKRGGRVVLKNILMPEVEFDHPEKVRGTAAATMLAPQQRLSASLPLTG